MRTRRTRIPAAFWVAALVLGLLIWAKLRLVAGIPRTVLAEPRHAPAGAPSHAPR